MKDTFLKLFLNLHQLPELELSTELRCREVMKSNDIDKIKRFCCDLMRNQAKCDAVAVISFRSVS